MRLVPIAVLAGVAGLGGCGGGIPFDEFADERRDANCGYYIRCGAFSTVADCRTHFDRTTTSNASLEAAVDAGKIRYDGDAAEDCVAALDDLVCDLAEQDHDALAACDEVFTGTGKIGATCAFDGECVTERCMVPVCDEACCQGTCAEPRVLPGLGEPCSTICADDLFCGYAQVCEAPLLAGEPCNSFTVCAEPLYCSSTLGACASRPKRGETCDGYCASEGDVCSQGLCVAAAVGGDRCTVASDCSQFYICNFDIGSCALPEVPPASSNGTPCNFNIECASHYCDAICSDPPLCF